MKTKYVGQEIPRWNAADRVTGRARFGADMEKPGDLCLAVLRAKNAPARIEAIKTGRALAMPGVARVFTAADIPGENLYGIIKPTRDQEVLAGEIVRCTGQAVALVAAETKAQAIAAAKAIEVAYSELPGVFDPFQALAENAPQVQTRGNLLHQTVVQKGEVEKALAASAVTVSNRYRTSMMEHAAIEPEGGRAEWDGDTLVFTACTQNPHYDQADLAAVLGLPKEKVRVVQAETGGGFGGKLDLSVQLFCGLAAYHLKRPASLVYSREESMLATAKRHPLVMDCTTGADAQGNLTAAKVEIVGDTGAFASYALAVCTRAAVHALGPYRVPNLYVRSRMVYTNNPWAGAMRGFGVPQASLAHEGQMNALAAKLGLDPLEMRLKNALVSGDETVTGQKLGPGAGLVECLQAVQDKYRQWSDQAADAPGEIPAAGVGAMFYGIGNTAMSNPSTAKARLTAGGELHLFTGAADIGQGSDTVLAQIGADSMGWDLDKVKLFRGDTGSSDSAGATSASRQTFISGNAMANAVANLKELLLAEAEELMEISRQDLKIENGRVLAEALPEKSLALTELAASIESRGGQAKADGDFDPVVTPLDRETGQGDPYQTYAFAAHAVRLGVDRDSGEVRVKEVIAAHDVGRAVNPRQARGQIAGGVVMGLGYTLMEEFTPHSTHNLDRYHIPTVADAPAITPVLVEKGDPEGPFGAKGLGEPALIPIIPAIAGAVSKATGKTMNHLPLTLERVMAALEGEE